jgi:hypothetical protein
LVPKAKITKKNGGEKREDSPEQGDSPLKIGDNTNIKRRKRIKPAQGD